MHASLFNLTNELKLEHGYGKVEWFSHLVESNVHYKETFTALWSNGTVLFCRLVQEESNVANFCQVQHDLKGFQPK